MSKTIRIPVYTFGKYRAQDGTEEEFTDESMREMARNTNFVIKAKPFIPTFGYVGYDHPVFGKVKDTDAHGHIKAAVYEDGVFSYDVLPIPDREGRIRLLEDAKAGRRVHVSGEHSRNFSFVDGKGKTVNVGRCGVGLAALGSERPALKNPNIVPLSELEFPDTVAPADAFAARETLRNAGMVAQTFSEGVLVFSEVQLSTDVDDEPKEQNMTPEDKAEFERLLAAQRTALTTEFATQLAAVKAENDQKITAMSEGAEKRRKILDRVAVIVAEKKLGKIAAAALEEAALNPTTDGILAFGEKMSAVVLPGGSKEKQGEGEKKGESTCEPEALAKLRPLHFSDMTGENEALVFAGISAFAEFRPDAFKGIESNEDAQLQRLRQYVRQRDLGA